MQLSSFNQCFVFLSFILFSGKALRAQYDEKHFVRHTVQNGLSNNYINCIQQDDWGNIWVGTFEGLNRFDGNFFTKYYHESTPLPLPSNIVFNIKNFGSHRLGIITRRGFQLVNTKDLTFHNYLVADSTRFNNYLNNVYDAVQLPDSSFAMTTASGFYVLKKGGLLNFRYDAFTIEDMGKKRIMYGRDILPLSNSDYLIFEVNNGLAYYNAGTKRFHKISNDDKTWSSIYPAAPQNGGTEMVNYYRITKDEFILFHIKGKKMVYYNHALKKSVTSPVKGAEDDFNWESKIEKINDTSFCINGGLNGFYLFHLDKHTGIISLEPKKYLPDYKIQCLFLDKEQRLWVGTSRGLLQQKFDTPLLKSHVLLPSTADGPVGAFTAAYRYRNKLYIGRDIKQGGLLIADPVSMKVEKEIKFFGKDNDWNRVNSIQMYHPDTLWITTVRSLLWFDIKTHRYGDIFKETFGQSWNGIGLLAPPRKDGYAWMCGFHYAARYNIESRTFTFYTDTTTPKVPFEQIKSIAYDAYGDVWLGGHSLARWNNKKEIFDTLITVYGGPNKYNEDILTLAADANGSLWLHNAENGLLQYRIKEKEFIHYGRKDGMPTEELGISSPVIQDILWIGNSSHLIRFHTKTKKISVYDANDGLPEETILTRRMYYDSIDRKIYMLFNNSIVTFPSSKAEAPAASEILVDELRINDLESIYYPQDKLRLNYKKNNLSLRFFIIDFENNNYWFDYRINETQKWTSLHKQRTINLSGLSPGTYRIFLRAMGRSGEQKLKTFSFSIAPPFWKTIWFYSIVGLLALAIFYSIYRYHIKQVHEKANIDKLLAQTELKALHAQMNPHFISNSLNSIREMILNDDNQQASRYLTRFAHLIRVTLDQSTQSFISVHNTIDYLNRYIEMEKIRNNKFTCSIYADEELDVDDVFLPPMLIQPFVENAIWHGVGGTGNSVEIKIHFKKEAGQLVCTIEDNGIGIEKSIEQKRTANDAHRSVAVSNIKQRISLLNEKYNLRSSVTIEDKFMLSRFTETGTKVTLKLPLQINQVETD